MYVIVETTNKHRGSDSVFGVYGTYATEEEALAVCHELRAFLPGEYESHEDYPIGFTVLRVLRTFSKGGELVRVAA